MNLAGALVYWVIIAIWLAVLITVAVAYYKNPRTFGGTRLLLIVVGIDTARNVIENFYFGLYWGAQYGVFSASLIPVLGKPYLLIIPKIINVLAASLVIGLLLLRWLPMALRERKIAESEIRQTSEALAQEMEEHRRLFETSVDIIIVTDSDRVITRISRSCAALLGYEPAEMTGRYGGEFVAAANTETLRNELILCRQGEAIRNFQCDLIHKNGSLVPVALTGVWSDQAQRFFMIGRDMTEQKAVEKKLTDLAHFDQLTKLPNRISLLNDLNDPERKNANAVVAMFDLDGFKDVNDTLGHLVGDKLLTEVARRMAALVPDNGRMYRLGGDEFVFVIPDSRDPMIATSIADTILKSLEQRFEIDGHRIYIGASAGIVFAPADGTDADDLIANADLALYEAKASGGRKYRLFARTMRAKAKARHEMEGEIRRAFSENEFVLHFQPQIQLSDGAVVGAEALLRWQHPQKGLLAPAAFIDALAQSPTALEVGNWILQNACATGEAWRAMGLPVRMSVNLFPAQFHDEIISAQVDAALKTSGLPPELLEIEITENIALNNDDTKIVALHALRARGVGLAFDDFGTGHASLSCVRRYPLTRIKIDRSFIQNIDSNSSAEETAVASSIIAMAHHLGLSVTAEGVETASQAAFLQSKGCHEVQGYFYARPLPKEKFEQFLGEWPKKRRIA
jgi:diguanylate cyclase (GGDEF)-like protein/PAS domain S-box-containing protein